MPLLNSTGILEFTFDDKLSYKQIAQPRKGQALKQNACLKNFTCRIYQAYWYSRKHSKKNYILFDSLQHMQEHCSSEASEIVREIAQCDKNANASL